MFRTFSSRWSVFASALLLGLAACGDKARAGGGGSGGPEGAESPEALVAQAQKLGEVIYKEQQEAQAKQQPPAGGPTETASGGESSDDEPVDADFEVKT